ncbi:ABC transporter ATP-binding protein [Nonomuraea aurantiaca]|uniref:ABC transporter ATP-binding protein n=1 Tax=Nonomuraea aurantiaca TaxID=2878562 RepID=UPI001CDA51B4|nr:ABC transporter ATP-binding protein [Nonomuraea aurantiaca]MCA2230236.1 ABC transporter ATP-binding protein/permease [Nonomuraea aurantiaca]
MAQPVSRLLFQVLRRNLPTSAVYLLVSIMDALTGMLIPATLAVVVDAALGQMSSAAPLVLMGVMLALATVTEAMRELLGVRTSTKATAGLRHRLAYHLVRLDGRGRTRFTTGDLLTRLLEGAAETARLVPVAVSALVTMLTSMGGIIALFLIDPAVGLVFVVGAPMVWLLAKNFLRRSTELTMDYQRAQGKLASRLVNALSGIRTIRAAGTTNQEISRVLVPLSELHAHGLRFWLAQRDMGWQLSLMAPVIQVSALAMAGYDVSVGSVSPGGLLAVSGYLGFAMGVFRQAAMLAQFGRVRGAAQRLHEVLQEPVTSAGAARFPQDGGGAITVRGVRVVEEGRPVLDSIDLDIPAGSVVALVGDSGAGKSALASVVGGLRAPDQGRVLIDGVDLADADSTEVRRIVAYAFDRPALLGDTVRDAVGYGDLPVTPTAIKSALRDSDSGAFVARLPERELTPVRELRLSGGELQRLGLARAFCRDAKVLILDDALSSLDTATEVRITQALDRHRGTRLIITHRMSTAARADHVVWLRNGQVAVTGTHRKLLALPGYRAMFGQQADDTLAVTM